MPAGCLLDTSFLIALSSPERRGHSVARQYFEYCVADGVPLYLPTLVVMEFYRRQTLDRLGLNNFIILPFNFDAAVKAAQFAEQLQPLASGSDAGRPAVKVDVALLAQAHLNGIDCILSEDKDTLTRFCDALRERGAVQSHVLLMERGFDPNGLRDPTAPGLTFPDAFDDD